MPLLTITLVDDDPDMLAMLEDICREQFGAQLHLHALNGLPTVDVVAATAPKLVVLDLLLGEHRSGLGLLRDMRCDHRLAAVPTLVVTASYRGVQRYLDEAAWPNTATLMKPFSLDQFHEAVGMLLSATRRH